MAPKGAGPADAIASSRPRNEVLPGSLVCKPTTKSAAFQSDFDEARRRPDRNAEARIQAAIVEWVRTVAPSLIVFHPPNGGLRSKAEAARFKWIGTLPGVPDLVILGRDGQAWLLEVKAPGGYLSTEQRGFCDRCTALRIPFAIVRSVDDARRAFAIWGLETREVR